MASNLVRVTHYGTVNFGSDVSCEAVVLADGRRGFNRRQLAQTVGFHKNVSASRFGRFLAEIAPKALKVFEDSSSSVLMPTNAVATFTACDVIPELASEVIRSAVLGTLSQRRKFLIAPCLTIQESAHKCLRQSR